MNFLAPILGVTGGLSDTQLGIYNINDQRYALANTVTGNESPAELAALQQQDKGLSLAKVRADVQQEYLHGWQGQLERMKQKDRERRQRMLANGAIFA